MADTQTLADVHPEAAKYLAEGEDVTLFVIDETDDSESRRFRATVKHFHLISDRRPLVAFTVEDVSKAVVEEVGEILKKAYKSRDAGLHIDITTRSGGFTRTYSPPVLLRLFVADGDGAFEATEQMQDGTKTFQLLFATYVY